MHPLQLAILTRGLRLLVPGGRLCYSTCSLNPIENEAVVAAALRRFQCPCTNHENNDNSDPEAISPIRLVPTAGLLPGLRRSPGKATWRVMNALGQWVESAESCPEVQAGAEQAVLPGGNGGKQEAGGKEEESLGMGSGALLPTMFPPPQHCPELEHCVRVWPHFQGTGGFFVAVFERVAECTCGKTDHLDAPPAPMAKKERRRHRGLFPLGARLVPAASAALQAAHQSLTLPPSTALYARFDQTSSEAKCKTLFTLSPALASLLRLDGGNALGRVDPAKAQDTVSLVLHVVGAGAAVLEACKSDPKAATARTLAFQPSLQGVEELRLPLPGEARACTLSREDAMVLLRRRCVPLTALPSLGRALADLTSGRVCVVVDTREASHGHAGRVVLLCQLQGEVQGGSLSLCMSEAMQGRMLCRVVPDIWYAGIKQQPAGPG